MPISRSLALAGTIAASLALGACATVEEAVVEKTAKTFNTTLTGANEPGGGDPDGFGTAEVSVSDRLDQVCYDINNVRGLSDVTAAHIHRGAAGDNGPPVLTLSRANEGGFKGCEKAPEWLQDAIKSGFRDYYVNIHTTEYPNGAIRGQLGK